MFYSGSVSLVKNIFLDPSRRASPRNRPKGVTAKGAPAPSTARQSATQEKGATGGSRLRRGFRHCFAALEDAAGWTVLDPLSGRLVVARLDLPSGFDLPGFYRRAGLTVLGPFQPGEPRRSLLPPFAPFSCVSLCRAVLGAGAPFAVTPFGLFRALARRGGSRKIVLTRDAPSG